MSARTDLLDAAESIREWRGDETSENDLTSAALAYAESLGWLSPARAAQQESAMAEYVAVIEAMRGDAERLERAHSRILDAIESLAVAHEVTRKPR